MASTNRALDRWIGVGCAVGLHAVVLGALLQYRPVRDALVSAVPIMVSLITPPKIEVAPPVPPKPVPVRKPHPQPVQKPIEPPPIIAAPIEAASTFIAPPEPPPPPPVETPPKVEPVAIAPPPIVPPRFNAAYLQNPAPPYPSLSRRLGEQGRVLLRVLVSADGLAQQIELRASSGSSRLDQSALDTVKRWKFVPARQGNLTIAAWVLVPISFSLEG